MNRKGFTLMELLLVVAVLAIVAAAAAPSFFGGAQEAMEEAKKAMEEAKKVTMNSAYQNCISGSNMLMAIATSKGITPATGEALNWVDTTDSNKPYALAYYTPESARVFTNKAGASYIFSAQYNDAAKKVVIYYGAGNTEANATTPVEEKENATATLNNLWTTVNAQ